MITGNEPAMPLQDNKRMMLGNKEYIAYGITIRQYFAANERVGNIKAMYNYDIQLAAYEMEMEQPPAGTNYFKWWLKVEAKMRVMKADALIAELNKVEE